MNLKLLTCFFLGSTCYTYITLPNKHTIQLPKTYYIHKPIEWEKPLYQGVNAKIFDGVQNENGLYIIKVLKCMTNMKCSKNQLKLLDNEIYFSSNYIGKYGLDIQVLEPGCMLKQKVNGETLGELLKNGEFGKDIVQIKDDAGILHGYNQTFIIEEYVNMIADISNYGIKLSDWNPGNVMFDIPSNTWKLVDGFFTSKDNSPESSYTYNKLEILEILYTNFLWNLLPSNFNIYLPLRGAKICNSCHGIKDKNTKIALFKLISLI